ncbi:hypothetical protein NSQ91_05800 [Paenibacillus sp. FSL R7-0048]|uniref:hypothetical protein n=1 Tax=Paenibacillus sp. FSL R7-0048 TaxID=2954528 RepID=UPI0030FC57DF
MFGLLNKFEIKEWSLSFGALSATIGKRSDEYKEDILRELFVIRHILSNFCFRYDALQDHLGNIMDDDNERLAHIANELFDKVFVTYEEVSKEILGSKYFVLLEKEQRNNLLEGFNYITSEKVSMEQIVDYDLDPDEKIDLVIGLNNLLAKIDEQIELVLNSID